MTIKKMVEATLKHYNVNDYSFLTYSNADTLNGSIKIVFADSNGQYYTATRNCFVGDDAVIVAHYSLTKW